jgi:hypothetical protein
MEITRIVTTMGRGEGWGVSCSKEACTASTSVEGALPPPVSKLQVLAWLGSFFAGLALRGSSPPPKNYILR